MPTIPPPMMTTSALPFIRPGFCAAGWGPYSPGHPRSIVIRTPHSAARGSCIRFGTPNPTGSTDGYGEDAMGTPQSGIFALGTTSHAYLEFDLRRGKSPADLI